jgi:hypothetical protein
MAGLHYGKRVVKELRGKNAIVTGCSRGLGPIDILVNNAAIEEPLRLQSAMMPSVEPSEVAGLVACPPGFEPETRGKSASNFSYLQDRFCASDKRATNGW